MAIPPNTNDIITISDRRERVRELANISDAVLTNDRLDSKISMAEDVIDPAFDGFPADIAGQSRYIHAGNLLAAQNILLGLKGSENTSRATELRIQMEKVIKYHNDKSPIQNADTVTTTPGFDPDGQGDFA